MPIKIPDILIPNIFTMSGFDGGAALYVANWKSVQMLFRFNSNEFVFKYYIPSLN